MNAQKLTQRARELAAEAIPLPGGGETAGRHRRLMEVGREDLSLAKLVEAHWDAVAILAEAGRKPAAGALYAVWASEIPGQALRLEVRDGGFSISGTKAFSSGAGIVDRALITVGLPEQRLVEVDLLRGADTVRYDTTAWKTDAFAETRTGAATFRDFAVAEDALVGPERWYLKRPGFWHGACGPAACWAGGVAGLLDVAMRSQRCDAHTLAHLGAMHANVWALGTYLEAAGREIDGQPLDVAAACMRALVVRHLVEQACTDTLRRFARAYGPAPLAMDGETARRYHEADLYLRQSHAEVDLQSLGERLRDK